MNQLNALSNCVEYYAFTLSNDSTGDGFVILTPGGFQLFGSDNSSGGPNNTFYTAVAESNQTITFDWSYHTDDGPFFDPAGFFHNGSFIQLTDDGGAQDQAGSFSRAVLTGDTYGTYVASVDQCCGRANIDVSNFSPFSGPVAGSPGPIPGAGLLSYLVVGVGAIASFWKILIAWTSSWIALARVAWIGLDWRGKRRAAAAIAGARSNARFRERPL